MYTSFERNPITEKGHFYFLKTKFKLELKSFVFMSLMDQKFITYFRLILNQI